MMYFLQGISLPSPVSIITIILLWIIAPSSYGQSLVPYALDQLSDSTDVTFYAYVARTPLRDKTTNTDTGSLLFLPWKNTPWITQPGNPEYDYWIKIKLSAAHDQTVIWDFNLHERIHLWVHSAHQDLFIDGGFTIPLNKLSFGKTIAYLETLILADPAIHILAKIRPFSSRPYPLNCSIMTRAKASEKTDALALRKKTYFNFLSATLGILGFFSLFSFLQYGVHRDKSFLMYGFYLLALFLYFIKLLEYGYSQPVLFGYFNYGFELGEVVVSMMIISTYALFVSYFLNLKEIKPEIHRWVIWFIWFSFLFILLFILNKIWFEQNKALYLAYLVFRVIFILLSLYIIVLLYSIRSALYYFIVSGSLILVIGSGVALLMALTRSYAPEHFWQEHYFYFQSGVILEALCFGLGLGYKTRLLDLEKQTAQADLIVQREKEISYQKALGEARISNLRARMNPHFIFNAMNAVQHLILDHQNNKAVTYLQSFSRLMRQVLDHSEQSYISLQVETEILENYIHIEKLRLVEKFDHRIQLQSSLPPEEIMIPQMIIQPFVENAILHGLKPLTERRGLLTIDFELKSEQLLRCTITDNGIGREAAAGHSAQKGHVSKAIRLIQDRLKLLDLHTHHPVTIEDLADPAGTRVVLLIPVKHEF